MIADEQPSLYQEFEQFRLELVSEGYLASIELQPTLISQIKEAQKGNASIDGIKSQIAAGKAPGFTEDEEGVLWYNGRLCVPSDSELKQVILKEAHDTLYSIHPGGTKMYQDLKEQFWWHGMKRQIGSYIAKCDICRESRQNIKDPQDCYSPPQIPEWKWDSVGMDFITGLPKSSKGNYSIWVVVDRLTKVAHFIPFKTTYQGPKLVELYISRIVTLHGTPKSIVSDRGSQFTSRFWQDVIITPLHLLHHHMYLLLLIKVWRGQKQSMSCTIPALKHLITLSLPSFSHLVLEHLQTSLIISTLSTPRTMPAARSNVTVVFAGESPQHAEHRHTVAHRVPSSPCPFKPQNSRAMDDLPRHLQHPLPSINRATPSPNSSHHQLLLPSLLLLDQTTHPIVAGASSIYRRRPPVHGSRRRRLELPHGTPPVPAASSPSPTSPRTSPSTAGGEVRSPTPYPRRQSHGLSSETTMPVRR
ncbi:hypothetical protein QYE76_051869 [Lolium multiflorum]|uniref:Integrase catalytic domain-containing protein n=1 Tax=Lolium multiflorum TaxID=4521 RepID=A0AAD8STK7_LOLMU|nr:hypothetical protein QYE76_051869 [Lolium multiflorum]